MIFKRDEFGYVESYSEAPTPWPVILLWIGALIVLFAGIGELTGLTDFLINVVAAWIGR